MEVYMEVYSIYSICIYFEGKTNQVQRLSFMQASLSLYHIMTLQGFIYIVSEERLACKRARSTEKSQRKGRRWTKKAKSAHSLRVSYHRKKVKGVYFGDVCGGSKGDLFF